MSLTTNPESKNKAETKSNENLETIKSDDRKKFSFLLLAANDDLENQKPMVDKILKALGVDFTYVVDSLIEKTSEHVFVFGELEAPEESYFFPSLLEVSQDQDLKKELWDELKAFKK